MDRYEKTRVGNDVEFRSFFDVYSGQVFHFFWQRTEDQVVAEDLTQLVFIKLWERRAQLSTTVPLNVQLFQIARTSLIDFYRAETSRKKMLAELSLQQQEMLTEPSEGKQTQIRQLETAIGQLPPRRREILQLSRRDGLTHEEIATELSISKNTVRVQISKALLTLRNQLTTWLW